MSEIKLTPTQRLAVKKYIKQESFKHFSLGFLIASITAVTAILMYGLFL